LLRTINLLQSVTSGHVLVDGKDVTKARGNRLRVHRRNIGMIFQHFNLADNLTVYQNIAFVLRTAGKSQSETDETVRKYLSLVGISEKADVYPSKLSGGQKQRVAIARALAGGAKILLCDEPTSALDAETTISILNLIRTLSKQLGITVVIITHELEVIKSICNRCAVMDGGQVVEIGRVYDIFTHPQHDYTRQLIGHVHKHDLPPEVLKNTDGLLVKLTFRGSGANMPVISEATVRFGMQFNILVGRIEYIENKPLGVLYVNPVGETETVRQALDYLKEVVSEVEVIDHGGI
jgi:D-methionine transport system ATP-binding protein